jgi:hypothetical protein
MDVTLACSRLSRQSCKPPYVRRPRKRTMQRGVSHNHSPCFLPQSDAMTLLATVALPDHGTRTDSRPILNIPPSKRLRTASSASASTAISSGAENCRVKTAEEKVADRRRRNREASSRSYYNRKSRHRALEAEFRAEKTRLALLSTRERELREESVLLKKMLWYRRQKAQAHSSWI